MSAKMTSCSLVMEDEELIYSFFKSLIWVVEVQQKGEKLQCYPAGNDIASEVDNDFNILG